MNPIAAPINRDSPRDVVANLQDALLALLRDAFPQISDNERSALDERIRAERGQATYGDATAKLVGISQEQSQLPVTGTVDEPTANALNRFLRDLGVLHEESNGGSQRTVAGQVLQLDQRPFAGTVIVFLENAAGSVRLGEDVIGPEGRYRIAYAPLNGADRPRLRVAAFDSDAQRRAEKVVENSSAIEIVDLQVESAGSSYLVTGTVSSTGRAGVAGLRVLIVDRQVGGDATVGETATDAIGEYRASFTYSGRKQSPDLQARVLTGERVVGTSLVRYNASNVETLDVVVAAGSDAALAAEHETLLKEIAPHFDGSLRDLKETETQQDITFLANKTGWDARAVAMAALADQFSARTADASGAGTIPPALFYTLFRAGFAANEAALYRTDPAWVEAVWKQGVQQGVVPPQMTEQIPAALQRYQALAARHALEGRAGAGLSSLRDLLKVSLPNAAEREHELFSALQVQHRGNPEKFWNAVQENFGEAATKRLRLDGQLSFLTLNNAPLIGRLHVTAGRTPLSDPLSLIEQGYYRASKWRELIGTTAVPEEISGRDDEERRANYADIMATQLRLGYPTATAAAMVKAGETSLSSAAPAGAREKVHRFLSENHERFDIGTQPIEQFARRQAIALEPEVTRELKRIQRVRQITTGPDAMNALLKRGVDSAAAVARYEREEFIRAFQADTGGPQNAALIHAKAQQVHNVVLNVALSYLTASNAPGVGVHSPAQIINPAPDVPANAGDVIAYASLEKLLGEQDYCDCEHCRSVLSPAAYLVDLLHFLDRDEARWKQFLLLWKADHENAPYPFRTMKEFQDAGQPANTEIIPLEVLLSRRPDLQHLPLQCENTNTALPYIDIVNETLEYYITHALTLAGYTGHSTNPQDMSEDLLATPRFVEEKAYDILSGKSVLSPFLPPTPPLPFHLPLESIRRYFQLFEAPLARVMEALRESDAIERASPSGYGWRDIWMEELRLARAEHALLTDRTLSLQQLFGFAPATTDAAVLAELSNAKGFTRRLGLTYEELLELLRTRFINPNGALIPKLDGLGVPLSVVKSFKDGTITDQQFESAISPQVDAKQYGGDVKKWAKNQTNFDRLAGMLVLADPSGTANVCSFDSLEFRYADPARLGDRVRAFEFVRLLRFIRLWKKLGWSIEETDKAISALAPPGVALNDADDAVNLQRLDDVFLSVLPRLGVVKRLLNELSLKRKKDLIPLLACFGPIDTYGPTSLYRRLFLTASLLNQAPVFVDNGFGDFLTGSQKLLDQAEAIRSALALTDDEFKRIAEDLAFDATTALTVDNVSVIFRRAWLARTLKLSVRELLLLVKHSGIDPSATVNLANPQIAAFIRLVDRLRKLNVKPGQALYLVWDEDLSGRSRPEPRQIDEFARSLRAAFAAVESEFNLVDDPDGQIARSRMALVYDSTTTDLFFGLLNNTLVTIVPYAHSQPTLEQNILDAAPGQIAYDDFRKQLSFSGVMTEAIRDALKVGAPLSFEQAVDKLYKDNQSVVGEFFQRYPELKDYYDAYAASAEPLQTRRTRLLEKFLPGLRRRRKRQQALQAISAAAGATTAFGRALLEDEAVLVAHAGGNPPALDDLTALEQAGLSAEFYFRDTATGNVDRTIEADSVVEYGSPGRKKLPPNGANAISGIWRGSVEAHESGLYNLRVEADAGATVSISLAGAAVELQRDGNVWSNKTALELRAGVLQPFVLRVDKTKDVLRLQWQSRGRGWQVIPGAHLYPAALRDHLARVYVRFFKAVSIGKALQLTAAEIAHLAARVEYQIGGTGWLNSLPVNEAADEATSVALFKAFVAVLDFAALKAQFSPDDERLLEALTRIDLAAKDPDGVLFALTRWSPASLQALLTRLGKTTKDLANIDTLRRVSEAYAWLDTLGISAKAALEATGNEPNMATVRALHAALRARYAEKDWLNVIRPVNDELRGLRRDALVGYTLHQLRSNPGSAHIDTADKLFEFFMMDVQMEPCMLTSRIRHALSAVQLFIERCLMNLEPRVASAAINPKHWQWMKRYRLWEANRKIFLWPENFLLPELRHDQSVFFKEMMSELLQGDITDDRAASALGGYLSGLHDVAKLQPLGLHFAANEPSTADDVTHVIARTAGTNRKHYYRRRENGYWTPWEPVKLDIEDNPAVPVVWKNRLLLVWAKMLKVTPPAPAAPFRKDTDLSKLKTSDVKPEAPSLTVQALLCWSEYYNGKWQPTRTSDLQKPARFGDYWAQGDLAFRPADVYLATLEEKEGLRVIIRDPRSLSSYLMYNTHSVPVREEDTPSNASRTRFVPLDNRKSDVWATNAGLSVLYSSSSSELPRPVLRNVSPEVGDTVAVPDRHLQLNPWASPFILANSRHVFYVTTAEKLVTIAEYQNYGGPITQLPKHEQTTIPPLVFVPVEPLVKDPLGPIVVERFRGVVDPAPLAHFVSEDAYIKKGLGAPGTVQFGGSEVGPGGIIAKAR